MTPVDYFKLQAKNLFRDYKTQYVYLVDKDGTKHYTYNPKYFNVDGIFLDFDVYDEENFSLMKAQHLVAKMVGFNKWADLLNASGVEQEYAKLRFENQDKIPLGDWDDHIANVEHEHDTIFGPEFRLEFFKHSLSVAIDVGGGSPYTNYLLDQSMKDVVKSEEIRQMPKQNSGVKINSLPLSEADRAEFVEAAQKVFEDVFETIEPNNPQETRKLWDAEDYVDNHLLTKDMLPISKDYALSLIEAFLVHHVIGLAVQADRMAA